MKIENLKEVANLLMKFKDLLLVLFSGILLIFSFPNFDFSFFAWVAFLPLFYVLQEKKPFNSFFIGWIWGTLFFLGTIYWVINTMVNYGNISVPLSVIILILFSLFQGFFFAVFTYFISYTETRTNILPWTLTPFVWVTIELLRTYVFSGFPWVLLGYSQYKNLNLIQISDVTSVYGISFLIVMINSCMYLALFRLNFKGKDFISFIKTNKTIITYCVAAILVIIFSISYGRKEIGEFRTFIKGAKNNKKNKVNISLIQGNIEQDKKWDKRYQDETIRIYETLTDESVEKGTDLVIWPETATPFYLQADQSHLNQLFNCLNREGVYLLTGSPAFEYSKEGDFENHNSAFLLSPDFKILKRYDKIHLVPFGEFVPLEEIFKINLFRQIIGEIGSFTSGTEETVFDLHGSRFGTLICYEIIYPDLVRKFVKKGAEFLVTITNDAWFGKSSAPYQHFAMVVFRAVENKVYVARAANTGISGFISPLGEIIDKTDIFTRGYLRGEVYTMEKKTFYTLYGNVFVWLCVFVTVFVYCIARFKKKDCLK